MYRFCSLVRRINYFCNHSAQKHGKQGEKDINVVVLGWIAGVCRHGVMANHYSPKSHPASLWDIFNRSIIAVIDIPWGDSTQPITDMGYSRTLQNTQDR
jgi:hypothetical protein